MDIHYLLIHVLTHSHFLNVRGLEVILTFEVKSATKCLQLTIETVRLILWVPAFTLGAGYYSGCLFNCESETMHAIIFNA